MPASPSSAETSPSCITPVAGQRRVLLVERERPAGEALVLERLAQHPGRAHRQAVVGEAGGAGVGQLGHLGELLAALAAGDRREEAGGDARLGAGALAQRAQHRRRVHHRVGVGHREDRAVAAGGRGARAGVHVLLVLAARGAQVHVRVHEGGQRVQARGVHHLGAVGRLERLAELGDPAVAHEQVARAVEPGARVQEPRAADQQRGRRRGRAVELERRSCGLRRRGLVGDAGTPAGAPRPASSS